MNSNSLRRRLCWAGALIVFGSGCGTKSIPRAQLVGEVTLDGAPVEQAMAYLVARSPDSAGTDFAWTYAATVADGHFEFPLRAGPPPGGYMVIIQPAEPDSEVVLATAGSRQTSVLADRNRLQSAVIRRGPIPIELHAGDINKTTISLTSR